MAVREVYDKNKVYSGPYMREAPDLMMGFRLGYRASVLNVTGGLSDDVFEDNERDWSGDHNFNPPDVPGMFFLQSENFHRQSKHFRYRSYGFGSYSVYRFQSIATGDRFMPAEGKQKV